MNELLQSPKDTSQSCIFDFPDRPGRPVPPIDPDNPPAPPLEYPYEPILDWPPSPPVGPPVPGVDPIPGSNPHPYDYTGLGVINLVTASYYNYTTAGDVITSGPVQPAAFLNLTTSGPTRKVNCVPDWDVGSLYHARGYAIFSRANTVGIEYWFFNLFGMGPGPHTYAEFFFFPWNIRGGDDKELSPATVSFISNPNNLKVVPRIIRTSEINFFTSYWANTGWGLNKYWETDVIFAPTGTSFEVTQGW